MNKLFCFAFLLVACLAAFTAAQTPYTHQLPCKDYGSCLCITLPKMIAAAKGRPATATLTNPQGVQEVYDLSKPMSSDLSQSCAKILKKP